MDNRGRVYPAVTATSPESALASELFDQFVSATTFKSVLSTYRQLCDVLRLKPTNISSFYPRLKAKLHSWRAASLWAKLDKRASHKCYNRGKSCPNTRVLLIGAGPCGLRAAIEAQLLGAKVVVVEKRDRFSRNNVLHLWPFVIHDLRNLGAKKFFGKFCAGSIDHISIRQLQLILLKVALLLGVEVHENVGFGSLLEPPDDQRQERIGWRASVVPIDHPVSQYEFDALIGADGKRNTLLGFNRKEFRGKLAIAVTANFINRHTLEEARVAEISGVAFIFNQKFFQDMREQTAIDLENIVYYKDDTHYFVMTAKKQSLLDRGVIINDYNDTARLLSAENVDREALMEYARDAADFATNYQLPSLDFAVNHYGQADVAMFDFTSMYAAENACRITERKGHRLLQGLVGDSLLEPFWPTGSGCARGFLSSFDATWMIRSWSSGKLTPLQVLSEREAIYRLLAQTTPENLSKDLNQYTLNPSSRYPNLNLHSVLPSQVRSLYVTDGKIEEQITDSPVEMPKRKRRKESIIHPDVLLNWCQRQVALHETIKIENLTSSWKNGLALCAILHRYRPDLINLGSLNPDDVAKNNQLAFDICEKELGIPPVMTGEEMAACEVPDKLSMVSYLAQVYETFRGEIPVVCKFPKSSTDDRAISPNRQSLGTPRSILTKISNKFQNKRKYSFEKELSKEKADSMKRSRHLPLMHKRRSKDKGIALDLTSSDVALTNYQTIPPLPIIDSNDAPKESINSRAKYLEMKMRRDAGLRCHLVEETEDVKTPLRSDHSELNIKLIQERLQKNGSSRTDKRSSCPKVGRLRKDEWNVKMLEEKICQQQKTVPKSTGSEKSRILQEIYVNKLRLMEAKLRAGGALTAEEKARFEQFDSSLSKLNERLTKGNLEGGERGHNQVAAMTEHMSMIWERKAGRKRDPLPPPPVTSSTCRSEPTSQAKGSEICYFCKKRVYLMERLSAEGLFFHRSCFKCEYCSATLHLGNYSFDKDTVCEGKFYCRPHFRMQKPDHRWQEMMKRKQAFLSTAFDEQEKEKVYTTLLANVEKALSPNKQTEEAKDGSSVTDSPAVVSNDNKAALQSNDIKPCNLLQEPAGIFGRDQTPERVEYENSFLDYSEEELLTSELEEEELTQKNFGPSQDYGTSADEYSDISSTDSESDEEAYAEELERSLTADETRKLAERWHREYSVEHSLMDSDASSSSANDDASDTEIGSEDGTSDDIDSDEEYNLQNANEEASEDHDISKATVEEQKSLCIDDKGDLTVEVPVIDLKGMNQSTKEETSSESDISKELDDSDKDSEGSDSETEMDSESEPELQLPPPQIPTIVIEESPPQNIDQDQEWTDDVYTEENNVPVTVEVKATDIEHVDSKSTKIVSNSIPIKEVSDEQNNIGMESEDTPKMPHDTEGVVEHSVAGDNDQDSSRNDIRGSDVIISESDMSQEQGPENSSCVLESDVNESGSLNELLAIEIRKDTLDVVEEHLSKCDVNERVKSKCDNLELSETNVCSIPCESQASVVTNHAFNIPAHNIPSPEAVCNEVHVDSCLVPGAVCLSNGGGGAGDGVNISGTAVIDSKKISPVDSPCMLPGLKVDDNKDITHKDVAENRGSLIAVPFHKLESYEVIKAASVPEDQPVHTRESPELVEPKYNSVIGTQSNENLRVCSPEKFDESISSNQTSNSEPSDSCGSSFNQSNTYTFNPAFVTIRQKKDSTRNDSFTWDSDNSVSMPWFCNETENSDLNIDIAFSPKDSALAPISSGNSEETSMMYRTANESVIDKHEISPILDTHQKIKADANTSAESPNLENSSSSSEYFTPSIPKHISTPIKPFEKVLHFEASSGKSGPLTPISENDSKYVVNLNSQEQKSVLVTPLEDKPNTEKNIKFVDSSSIGIRLLKDKSRDASLCASSPNLTDKTFSPINKDKSFNNTSNISSNSSTTSSSSKTGKYHGYSGSFAEKIRPKSSLGDTIYLRSLDINLQKQCFPSITKSTDKLDEVDDFSNSMIRKKLFHTSDKALGKKSEASNLETIFSPSKQSFKRQTSVPADNKIQFTVTEGTTPVSQKTNDIGSKGIISPFGLQKPIAVGDQNTETQHVHVSSADSTYKDPISPYTYSQSRPDTINVFPVKMRPKCDMDLPKLSEKREKRKSLHENIQGLPFADEEKAVTPTDAPLTPGLVFPISPKDAPYNNSTPVEEQELSQSCKAIAHETARKEARARARLKSDEELGLSPKNYRKKYQRQLSLSSIYYEELNNDEFYDHENEELEDEVIDGTFRMKRVEIVEAQSDLSDSDQRNVSITKEIPSEGNTSTQKQISNTITKHDTAGAGLKKALEVCTSPPKVLTNSPIAMPRLHESEPSSPSFKSGMTVSDKREQLPSTESLGEDEKLKHGNRNLFFSILNFGKSHVHKEKHSKSRTKDTERASSLPTELCVKQPPKQKQLPNLKLSKSKERAKEKRQKHLSITSPDSSPLSDALKETAAECLKHSVIPETVPENKNLPSTETVKQNEDRIHVKPSDMKIATKRQSEEQKGILLNSEHAKIVPKYMVYRNPGVRLTAIPSHVPTDKAENGFAPKASEDSFSDTEDDTQKSGTANNASVLFSEKQDKELSEKEKKAQRMVLKVQRQQELKRLRTAQEIQRRLEELEVQQKELEQQGVKVEKALRGEGRGLQGNAESNLMQEWYKLIHSKNQLAREEQELLIRLKDLELEDRHSRLQQEMRERMAQSASQKNSSQIGEEKKILTEMLRIVEERDELVAMLEQLRLKEEEEEKQLGSSAHGCGAIPPSSSRS